MAHVATVTISAAKVPADQTNFTVEIDLAHMPTSFWSAVASGGGDIRAFKSDGTTELPREVVKCDTGTDTGKLCVKYSGLLSSSTDTDIQIHADGVSSDYAATHQYGRNAVWSEHESVHHFEDLSDSTGNGYDLSNNGASVTNGVADFPASDASLVAQRTGPSGTGNLSFSFCLKTTQAGTNKHLVNIGAAATDQMFLAILNDGVLKAGAWGVNTFGTTTLNDGAEHWIDCDYDGSRMRAYVDGALEVTSALYSSLNVADLAYHLGHYRGGGSVFALDGEMSCFSVAKASHSAQYYETRHANRSDPASFYSVVEVSGGGGTTLNADSGTFAQTGTDASLKADRLLSAISGSYTATTDAVNLLADRVIAAATGGYTAGGQDASLLADRTVNAGASSYTLTGQDVALLKQASLVIAAGSGAFALNTQSAQLLFNRVMPAASGSITLTGQDVTLQYVAGSTLVAGSGDFLASGGDVALVVDRKMQAATGSLTAVYDDAGLVRGYVMDATGENLTLTGQDLNLLLDRALQAGTATFTETGSPVVLLYSGVGLFPDLEGEITLVSVTPKITLQSKTPKITVH